MLFLTWKENVCYGVLLTIIFTALLSYVTPVRFSAVQGHSMEPTISAGDAVVIVSVGKEDIRIGDIIAFKPEPDRRVIHRVITIENGKIRTMGDNSQEPDSWIKPSQVVGEYLLSIPYVGTIMNHANSTVGFVLFIVLPAVLIIYNEGKRIKNELGGDRKAKE